MQAPSPETSQPTYARLAGLMYLVVLALDLSGVVITSAISGGGGFSDASHRIAVSETLYRVGLCCGLAGSLATIPLAVSLFVTLRAVDAGLATMALAFRVVESAGGTGTAFGFATLAIHLDATHGSAFAVNQLAALADLTSGAGTASTGASAIFFCLGSTIFFYLFLRSAYIPRGIAGLGVFASLLYASSFFASLMAPASSGLLIGLASLPILLAEVSAGLWLLIRGIRIQSLNHNAVAGRT